MSAIEYGAKLLDINVAQVAQRILDKGGADLGGVLQRRYVYDIEPGDTSRWVRLRDTGNQVTLTVKEIDSDAIGGTRETETTVGDFEITNALLDKLGYTEADLTGENSTKVYAHYGIDLSTITDLRFEED